jgi:trehalose 6-phosphate phosphatase
MPVSTMQSVLSQRPVGLALDFDGTLSPIVPTAQGAQLYPGARELLERARRYARVAIMTGRAIDDGAKKINVEGLTYIGTHGLEWSEGLPWTHPVETDEAALAYAAPGKYLLDLVAQHADELPGVYIQRKHIGGTLHYRLASDPEETRQKLLAILTEPARRVNMSISEGKRMVEVRVPLAIDKGQALLRFARRYDLHGVLFAGDDLTDLDAVLAVPRLRAEGIAALSVVVQHPDTLPELLRVADIVVPGVPGMVALLAEAVEWLEHAAQ